MDTALDPQLVSLLQTFDTGMLATTDDGGHLHARPMALGRCDASGKLYFLTTIDGGSAEEIERDPHVEIIFQGTKKFVSLTGMARLSVDRSHIEELWSPFLRVWFPEGKHDPSLCIVEVEAESAEYWDNRGLRGLAFLFETAKAFVAGLRGPSREGHAHGRAG